MMRDLLFHVTILWLVLGALLIATSSLVSSRDREDSLTNEVDLEDDATNADSGESYAGRYPRIMLSSDLVMQTDIRTVAPYKAGIYILSYEGKLLDFVPIPRDEVTNCALGGDDLRTLYITAGGTLWSIRVNTPDRGVSR